MHDRVIVPDYFVSPVPELWAIDETGEAIEWKDQQCTAIMLPHLQILCRALADHPRGLPSLTAILFIVDALSKGWSMELADERVSQLLKAADSPRAELKTQLVEWLHSLQSIDSEFRHGAAAHMAFLCELFEDVPGHWLTDKYATTRTLDWLENTLGDRGSLLSTRLKADASVADRAITTLDFASMQNIDSEWVRLRMRIGLNELPQAESLDVLERFPLAALTKQLANTRDDLGAVARMAQSVSATLTLPRLPSDPDVLPIGGVSDVTNRGQPDRLLMSELAMDTDLLIARIANGQALYLRREQPPQPEPKHRSLIIECGVRMWGSMRLYSAAFALGLCIAQERRGGGTPIDVVTVAGDSAWREDLTSRQGIERFYERLHPDVHPAEALTDLMQHRSLDLDLDSQPILVLSEATERDGDFRRLTSDFPKPHLLARIEQAGWVELLQRSSMGDTSLQRMKLSEIAPAPELKRANPDGLPLFLKQSPCPLRFAMHPSGLCVQAFDAGGKYGCWVLTHDRRVMLLEDPKFGAIEAGCVPSGRVLASHPQALTWLLVLETAPHKTRVPVHLLVRVDLNGGVNICEIKRYHEAASEVAYCFDRGQLIRVGNYVTFLDSRTGLAIASAPRKGRHLGGVFFVDDDSNQIYVAALAGEKIQWEPLGKVVSRPGVAARLEQGMPVVYSHDFSNMVRLDGEDAKPGLTAMHLFTLYAPKIVRVNAAATEMLVAVRGVTSATDAQLIGNAHEEKLLRVSLWQPRVTYAGKHTPSVVTSFELGKDRFAYQIHHVRTHLSGLSFEGDELILHAQRKRIAIQIHEAASVLGFTCKMIYRPSTDATVYPFGKPVSRVGSPHARWKLRPIKLPSGQAWLDSRGLLHLRAADGSELSLTLSQGLLPGWHSSGVTFGPQYFTSAHDSYTNATPEVIHWLVNFVRQQHKALSQPDA